MRRTIPFKFAMIGAVAPIATACGGDDESATKPNTRHRGECRRRCDAGTDGDIAVVFKTLRTSCWRRCRTASTTLPTRPGPR